MTLLMTLHKITSYVTSNITCYFRFPTPSLEKVTEKYNKFSQQIYQLSVKGVHNEPN